MRKTIDRTLMSLALALIAPAALSGQQGQLPPEAQELVVEMQQLQVQLGPVQQQAMADPTLLQTQQDLGARVREAMTEIEPQLPAHMERLSELQVAAGQAQAAQDQERMAAIVAEAQQIEIRLQSAQQQAMERPEIEADLEAFQTRLEQKMVEIDPEVAPLLQRFRQIDAELRQLLQPRVDG